MSANIEGYRNESFESVEAAVLETPRGRWFLEEYAKRQRSAETLAILDILRKLENSIVNPAVSPETKPAEKISTEQLKFFKKDEDLFVEPTLLTASVVAVSPPPNPAPAPMETRAIPESKGAKLKIQRLAPEQIPQQTPAPVAATPDVPAPVSVTEAQSESKVEQPTSEADGKPPRVIIIRRPASEVGEIPMLDENSPEVAA